MQDEAKRDVLSIASYPEGGSLEPLRATAQRVRGLGLTCRMCVDPYYSEVWVDRLLNAEDGMCARGKVAKKRMVNRTSLSRDTNSGRIVKIFPIVFP